MSKLSRFKGTAAKDLTVKQKVGHTANLSVLVSLAISTFFQGAAEAAAFNLSTTATSPSFTTGDSTRTSSQLFSLAYSFDPSAGVLTGFGIDVVTEFGFSILSGRAFRGNPRVRFSSGSGTISANVDGINRSVGLIFLSEQCIASPNNACFLSESDFFPTGSRNVFRALTPTDLERFARPGSIQAQAIATANIFSDSPNTDTEIRTNWRGRFETVQTVRAHANPEIAVNATNVSTGSEPGVFDIDFGTVELGSTVAPISFELLNAAAGGAVGLDIDSIVESLDSPFSTNLSTDFGPIAAGNGLAFDAFFDTSTVGDFSTSITLGLSDADIGAPSTRFDYTLTLNLQGQVKESSETVEVPEPSSILGLLTFGALGIGSLLKHKQQNPDLVG